MNDLNFFQSYNKNQDKKPNKDLILYGLAIIIVLSMISYSIINLAVINELSEEISFLKQQVEIKKSDDKITDILEKEKEINVLKERLEQLEQLDKFIKMQDIITEHLLDSITARVPENVFLNSMMFNLNLITLDGIAKDKKSISDFEYKLKEIECFEDIFIPAISHEDNYYTFTVNIKPKEVDIVGIKDNN